MLSMRERDPRSTPMPGRLRALSNSTAIVVAMLITLGGLPANAQAPLAGVGSTFSSPLLGVWVRAYEQATGERIEYENIEPAVALRSPGRTVDFTVLDDPQTSGAAGADSSRYPLVIGGIVPVANIDGIAAGHLRLSGPVLADIYLGRIRTWNDDAIRNLNPALALPNANITVVHRNGASSGTLLWTRYLAHESTLWRSQIGVSARPNWPQGVGGAGNEGVGALVQRTRFSIGYADYFFVRQHRLRDVALDTPGGRPVRATHESLRAAIVSPDIEGWPMASSSWIAIEPSIGNASRKSATLRFICWATTRGASLARDRHFVIAPDRNLTRCRAN